MSLGMVQSHCGDMKYNMYSVATTKTENDKTFKMGTATREATGNGDGQNIGVMAIGNQAYLAQYSGNSTPAKPIVKVGNYEVRTEQVSWTGQANQTLETSRFLASANGTYTLSFNATNMSSLNLGTKTYQPSITIYWDDEF